MRMPSKDVLTSIRRRLDAAAGEFLMENPRTDDPRGILLASRIGRIQRRMGQELWDLTTAWTLGK